MTIVYRRFEVQDRTPVYQLFRESIWDFMLQNGQVASDDKNEIFATFEKQKNLYFHLEHTAIEDWVAEDSAQGLVGWARSIERDNHLELTHFFVSTKTQGKGVGRTLLDLAFAPGRGQQRSIIATPNPRALSLYLRYGVSFQGMAFTIFGQPQNRPFESDLVVKQLTASKATLDIVADIENQVLGYQRPTDLEFFMSNQPVFLFYRNEKAVAYAFGCDGKSAGPAGALNPEDLPALMHTIEQSACQIGMDSIYLTVPAAAKQAVCWALDNGYKIDPFYEVLLAKHATMQFDRYIMSESAFVW